MVKHLFILAAASTFLCGFELFWSTNSDVDRGNKYYKAKQYKKALKAYNQALKTMPDNENLRFNRGTLFYQLGLHAKQGGRAQAFQMAKEEFLRAINIRHHQRKALSLYNLGNTYIQLGRLPSVMEAGKPRQVSLEERIGLYKQAISTYIQALKLNPMVREIKYNLEVALHELKMLEEAEKRQQKKNKKNNKDKKDKKKKQDKKEQDKKKQDKKEQDKKKDKKEQDKKKQDKKKKDKKKDKKEQDKKKKQKQKKRRIPLDQRALNALKNQEKPLQLRPFMLNQRGSVEVKRDW